jgi:LysR substrate binding domain
MVAGGAGVTLLPELAVPTESRRAEIAIRRFAKFAPHRMVAFVWRKRSALGTALRRLADASATIARRHRIGLVNYVVAPEERKQDRRDEPHRARHGKAGREERRAAGPPSGA